MRPVSIRRVSARFRSLRDRALLGLVITLALGTASVACTGTPAADPDRSSEPPEQPSLASDAAGSPDITSGRTAPDSPPAEVCGSASLHGPARPPAGAVMVTPDHNLMVAAEDEPPGTTFWLTRGTHVLGPGEFTQVVTKDRQRFVGAPGAILDGRHQNSYAFTSTADGVHIEHLTIQNFGTSIEDNPSEAVVNHDGGKGWVIRHNTIRWNAGAGVFLGSRSTLAHNCLQENGQYGFTTGSARHVLVRSNEIAGNNTADWEGLQEGCGCTGGGKFWETRDATVVDNWVHDNQGAGVFVDTNNVGFLVAGNLIADNTDAGLIYETSYNAEIRGNTFVRNALESGPSDPGFPRTAVYISESGSDSRAGQRFGSRLAILGNRFIDNWGGVVGWENADRFAGSPVNTSTGYSTLVNPRVATVQACSDADRITTDPYYDDCRWKTRNVLVEGNLFEFTPSHFPDGCLADQGCGFNGLFANWGTTPDWSPYMETVVMDGITFEQDNLWVNNRYVGPWRFMIHNQGNVVSWETWRSTPYGQDADSTLEQGAR